jgi:hypothetical protein
MAAQCLRSVSAGRSRRGHGEGWRATWRWRSEIERLSRGRCGGQCLEASLAGTRQALEQQRQKPKGWRATRRWRSAKSNA